MGETGRKAELCVGQRHIAEQHRDGILLGKPDRPTPSAFMPQV
jgi:hypothetical protein